MKALLIFFALIGFSAELIAEVSANRRHVVIVWSGADKIYGQYLFTVQNSAAEAVEVELPIMLAKEKVDWFPQEGVLPKDVKLGEGGDEELIVKQPFKPGDTFIVFNFTAAASFGSAELTLTAPYKLGDLVIMTPAEAGSLELAAEGMKFQKNQPFAGKNYHMLQASEVDPGQTFKVQLNGVAEGRTRYWWIGGVFAGLLVLMGGVLTWRQKPDLENADEAIVEGTRS